MTRTQMRALIEAEINTNFDTSIANVFYENLEGTTSKGDVWIRSSIVFGEEIANGLSITSQVGLLIVQVFYRANTGGSTKDKVHDELSRLFNFKTLSNTNGLLQFKGGYDAVAPKDGEYLRSNYSVAFTQLKEIS